MKLNNLRPASGSTQGSKRLGRGQGTGKAGTSGKGHKGAQARSGYSLSSGFEGGQMPLQRRLPKFGFNNINRKEYRGVNLDSIQELIDSAKAQGEITKEVLIQHGLASKGELVKILGRGKISAAVSITADKFTKTAEDAINQAGGKAITLQ